MAQRGGFLGLGVLALSSMPGSRPAMVLTCPSFLYEMQRDDRVPRPRLFTKRSACCVVRHPACSLFTCCSVMTGFRAPDFAASDLMGDALAKLGFQ